MKNIFKIFSSENLKKNLINICERFPISIIIIFITASLFFTQLHYSNSISDFYKERIFIVILSLIMTFVFSIGTYLSTETSNFSRIKRNLFQIIPIGFGIIFYNTFSFDINDFENFVFFFLSFSGIIAFLFFAPYLKNFNPKQLVFYTYFYNISVLILLTFIFAGLLFGLGAIGIMATDALFDLNIAGEKTYGNWAILSLSIVTPIFALTQIPDKKNFLENNFKQNAFFSFLIKFVVIPFVFLYFFILYAYTIKVLSNFSNWPKGEVSWLVIGFSIFGYLAYIFSYIFEEKNKLIKNFRKIFPLAVIPQIFMLFYAIYLRINQYDITINRYFIVVFGLWLLIISLYFVISKKKKLIFLPVTLTLFIIIISIIPKYNVYNFPEERQLKRLENNLEKAKILQNNKIIPLKNYSDISQSLSKNIYSGIEYSCNFNNCEKIKKLFPKIYKEILEKDKKDWEENIKKQIKQIEKNKNKKKCKYKKYYKYQINDCYNKKYLKSLREEKYKEPYKWEIISGIVKKIKVEKYSYKVNINRKYINFSKNYNQDFFPINIKGYSKIYKFSQYIQGDKKYVEYDVDKEEIIIKEDKKIIVKFSTKEISKKLLKKFGKDNNHNLEKKDLIFELESGKYKLYFNNIAIINPEYKKENDENSRFFGKNTSGFLLVK